MTKKSLQDWYNSNNISYSEKEKLNKIGINNYDYHNLIDLQQILRCENWAQNSSEIRNNLSGRIRKIVFFTPSFNDSKPDASNYSCAIVTDDNDNNWAIVYRPSYVNGIDSDVAIGEASNYYEVESKLNSDYPVTAVKNSSVSDSIPYVSDKKLPSDVKDNPDRYLLPLDVVKKGIHYGVYLGNKWVVHVLGKGQNVKFDTWNVFCSPGILGSSNSLGIEEAMNRMHPLIPYKKNDIIIRHIAKIVSYESNKDSSYHFVFNNCEHLVKRLVFGIDDSQQVQWVAKNFGGDLGNAFNSISSTINSNFKKPFDELTSNYSYEKGKVEQYIREAERNRCYNHAQYRIEEEKFQERIEVSPKDWCRIS